MSETRHVGIVVTLLEKSAAGSVTD